MKDADFKILKHHAKGYSKFSDGKEVENNFSPDYVLNKGNDFILIEHETEPNRKTIVADVIKAAHFLQNDRTGILVIVMTPKRRSSLQSYPNHVKPYLVWVKDKTNLKEVYFFSEVEYFQNGNILEINSKQFNDLSIKIDKGILKS
jgi:hypothetical protein